LKYSVNLPAKSTQATQVPYTFHSELKPQELILTLYADITDADKKAYRITAYDQQVTILEPKGSWLDPQLYILYILIGVIFSGISYVVYTNVVKPQKPTRKSRSKKAAAPVSTPTTPTTRSKGGPGQYEDEWIPDHHKKKLAVAAGLPAGDAAKRRRGLAGATSEGESGTDGNASATSVSGAPRRRSARSKH